MTNTTLTFGEKTISLSVLLKNLKTLPLITLSREDLGDVEYAAHNPARGDEGKDEEISVYKHGEIYFVLSGQNKATAFIQGKGSHVKVRLVSKQALKHLQVVALPLQVQNRQAQDAERQAEEADRQYQTASGSPGYYSQPRSRYDRPRDQRN